MRARGWSNGSPLPSGAGYGVRMSSTDRDLYFEPDWSCVEVALGSGDFVKVPVTKSFWRKCTELRSTAIGQWLLTPGLAPWPRGAPPRLELVRSEDNRFRLIAPSSRS